MPSHQPQYSTLYNYTTAIQGVPLQMNTNGSLPITLKQQRSQTVQNYIEYLNEFYEDFQPQANSLQPFYPKQVQRHLKKRKNQNSDRIVHGLKAPECGPNGKPN